jgi:hypothetical protein
MIPVREMSTDELGAYVQTHLRKHNIQVVLSGGACVSIYSQGAYISHDLDMVILYSSRRQAIHAAMATIGFEEIGRYYVNPETQYLIEFPPGPLSIGAEPVQRVDEIELRTGTLRIISPTDCVKDRLAAYYHWGDRQCLHQAILVARVNAVDFEEIRRWSQVEGKLNEYLKIKWGEHPGK